MNRLQRLLNELYKFDFRERTTHNIYTMCFQNLLLHLNVY